MFWERLNMPTLTPGVFVQCTPRKMVSWTPPSYRRAIGPLCGCGCGGGGGGGLLGADE